MQNSFKQRKQTITSKVSIQVKQMNNPHPYLNVSCDWQNGDAYFEALKLARRLNDAENTSEHAVWYYVEVVPEMIYDQFY